MFTGIIEDVGAVKAIKKMGGRWEFTVSTSLDITTIADGDSIAVDGVCLTAIRREEGAFVADASLETLNVTTLKDKKTGDRVNLERAMRADSRFGGHIVMGHVDAVGSIVGMKEAGDSIRIDIEVPKETGRYIVRKGSVTLDGISLTVNDQNDTTFSVNIIPYSASKTTLKFKALRDSINVETDVLGRYVEKFVTQSEKGSSDLEFLYTHGYIRGK
jgi:riboflavin synthase